MSGTDATARRELVPLNSPPADRPRAESQPCATCGTLIDPLRADRVLVFDMTPGGVSSGMEASYVLGQADFTTRDTTVAATRFNSKVVVVVDDDLDVTNQEQMLAALGARWQPDGCTLGSVISRR